MEHMTGVSSVRDSVSGVSIKKTKDCLNREDEDKNKE